MFCSGYPLFKGKSAWYIIIVLIISFHHHYYYYIIINTLTRSATQTFYLSGRVHSTSLCSLFLLIIFACEWGNDVEWLKEPLFEWVIWPLVSQPHLIDEDVFPQNSLFCILWEMCMPPCLNGGCGIIVSDDTCGTTYERLLTVRHVTALCWGSNDSC